MTLMAAHILVVEESARTRRFLAEVLEADGHRVEFAGTAAEALPLARRTAYDIMIAAARLPDADACGLLDHLAEHAPETVLIVATGRADIEAALLAVRRGIFDYLTEPFRAEEVLLAVRRAQELRALKAENALLRSEVEERRGYGRLIGGSPPMQALYRIIERVAKTDSTVLVTGESGTGKELVANAVHYGSARREKPFIPINCGAIPEELLESELFGHEKGAFTGALRERRGRFELAHQGAIFLDEVGEMSPALQVKLLRFLQERTFERVGGSRTLHVDVRIVAATNRNLERAVAEGAFREDLYYRLNVIPIQVPPLRDRPGDLAALTHHFLTAHCRKKGLPEKSLSQVAIEALSAYRWPGNVRELENVIERMVILSDGGVIGCGDLPQRIRGDRPAEDPVEAPPPRPAPRPSAPEPLPPAPPPAAAETPPPEAPAPGAAGIDLKRTLEGMEERFIREALERSGGVKNRAAKLLGLNRTTLIEKMKKLRITSADTSE